MEDGFVPSEQETAKGEKKGPEKLGKEENQAGSLHSCEPGRGGMETTRAPQICPEPSSGVVEKGRNGGNTEGSEEGVKSKLALLSNLKGGRHTKFRYCSI